MKVFKKIVDVQNELFSLRKDNKTIGLVPTMGALHEGHASLVKRSVEENDVTIVSVFLNPTQFNDKGDLERYPRTLEADCKLLEQCGANYVFAPSADEIYPQPDTRQFNFPPQSTVSKSISISGLSNFHIFLAKYEYLRYFHPFQQYLRFLKAQWRFQLQRWKESSTLWL